jgi:hypothetical protein
VAEALEALYYRLGAEDGGIQRLDHLSRDDIRATMEKSVSSYIYNRWLAELGAKLEEKSVTPSAAIRLEREVREYVEQRVSIELRDLDILTIDWVGSDGRAIIDGVYEEAYSALAV